jgi:hypothetical protein|tara:strand:+ start:171 stop:854 length:684 start_codon:yes stop_codon:yes gene_type:complete
MKRLVFLLIFYLLIITKSFAHVGHYSNLNFLEYELFRNDKLIGYHKYEFERSNGNLSISSEIKFNITKLGVNIYKYKAISNEYYQNEIFTKFSANTFQNNKEKYANIEYKKDENKLIIDGSSYKGDAEVNSIVGTWWNHEIVDAPAQISAVSGRIIHQKVTFLGKEKLNINGKTYNALHYNFSSSDKNLPEKKKLNTDIWYDEKTKIWLKASFDKMGHWEYRIKNYN